MEWSISHKEYKHQLHNDFKHAQKGKGVHPFVGNHCRSEWDTDDADYECKNRGLKYIVCNRHPVLGDNHLFVQEPQAEGLECKQDNCRQYQMDKKSIGKNLPGISVLLSQFKGDETAGCSTQGAGDDCEHRDEAAHDIVDAIVFHSQHVQYHPGSIERHYHAEKHPDIEHQGVLRYAFIVVGLVAHHSVPVLSST